jgi:hypothetical protein
MLFSPFPAKGKIMSQVFDVTQYEAAEVGKLEVMDITGAEPLLFNGEPVVFELCGPGSTEYMNAQANIDRAQSDRMMQIVRGKNSKEDVVAVTRANNVRKLTACTRTIINFPVPGGPKAIYDNPRLGWLTAQVSRFIEDWANFPNPSAKT